MNIEEFSDLLSEAWLDLSILAGPDKSLMEIDRNNAGEVVAVRDIGEVELTERVLNAFRTLDGEWREHVGRINAAVPDVTLELGAGRKAVFPSAHAAVFALLTTFADNQREGFTDEPPFEGDIDFIESTVSARLTSERDTLNLEESSNPTLDPLDNICDLLSGYSLKLFNYLRKKTRPRTSFDTIRQERNIHKAFRKDDIPDGTIKQALKRLKKDLEADDHALQHIAMTVGVGYVKFERLKPGDK